MAIITGNKRMELNSVECGKVCGPDASYPPGSICKTRGRLFIIIRRTDGQTVRTTVRHKNGKKDGQTGRHTDRKADRQTDRQRRRIGGRGRKRGRREKEE